jgi:hypothetical protein
MYIFRTFYHETAFQGPIFDSVVTTAEINTDNMELKKHKTVDPKGMTFKTVL